MEIYPKNPQELAAQVVDAQTIQYSMDSAGDMVPHGQELVDQFAQDRNAVIDALNSETTDTEMSTIMDDMYAAGEVSGVVNPLRGDRATEVAEQVSRVYSWAPEFGAQKVARAGYLGAVRQERRLAEKKLSQPNQQVYRNFAYGRKRRG